MVIYDHISIIEIVTPIFPGNILFLDQTSVGKITSGDPCFLRRKIEGDGASV